MSKNVLRLSPNNSFSKEVIDASKSNPVMVDFFATWCGPCRKLSPLLESASAKYSFKLVIVDVDQNPDVSNAYNIGSIPHVFLFHRGSQVMDFTGYDTNQLEKMLDYIKKNVNKFSGKGVTVGGHNNYNNPVPKNVNVNSYSGNVPAEPKEGENTYELAFKFNNDTFSRRFLGDNTIGEVRAYVKNKVKGRNVNIFTPFPRKVYDNDGQKIKDSGLAKREMLQVALA